MKRKVSTMRALAIGFAATAGCSSGSSSPSQQQTDGGSSVFTHPLIQSWRNPLRASGEVLALTGYAFPPVNPGDPAFVAVGR